MSTIFKTTLREEIFGVDYITDLIDSSSENSLTNLSATTSAMYCIQSISNHIISTEKVPIKTPEIVISQPQSLHRKCFKLMTR